MHFTPRNFSVTPLQRTPLAAALAGLWLALLPATPALAQAERYIEIELSATTPPLTDDNPDGFSLAGQPYLERPDVLLAADLTPWLLRRLQLACAMARELRLAAARVQL